MLLESLLKEVSERLTPTTTDAAEEVTHVQRSIQPLSDVSANNGGKPLPLRSYANESRAANEPVLIDGLVRCIHDLLQQRFERLLRAGLLDQLGHLGDLRGRDEDKHLLEAFREGDDLLVILRRHLGDRVLLLNLGGVRHFARESERV